MHMGPQSPRGPSMVTHSGDPLINSPCLGPLPLPVSLPPPLKVLPRPTCKYTPVPSLKKASGEGQPQADLD